MANGNVHVAEVTYLRSTVIFLNLADRQKKVIVCTPHDHNTFHKVWLKLDENRGSSCLLKILTLEIFAVH